MIGVRCFAAGWLLAAAAISTPTIADEPPIGQAASDLIALTRETDTAYSVVHWNRIELSDGTVVAQWAAEFHDRNLHRVETPYDRLIADCAAMTGTRHNLVTGEMTTGAQVAREACGIQANSEILSAEIKGRRTTRFGPVTHIVIRDPEHIRTYDVADSGALLAATISDIDGKRKLTNWAVRYLPSVKGDVFSPRSLSRSVVPDDWKRRPAD